MSLRGRSGGLRLGRGPSWVGDSVLEIRFKFIFDWNMFGNLIFWAESLIVLVSFLDCSLLKWLFSRWVLLTRHTFVSSILSIPFVTSSMLLMPRKYLHVEDVLWHYKNKTIKKKISLSSTLVSYKLNILYLLRVASIVLKFNCSKSWKSYLTKNLSQEPISWPRLQ